MSKNLKILSVAIIIGVLAGVCSSFFLHSLKWITSVRESYTFLIWGLPIFGFLFGLLLKKIPHHINQGVPYILSELDNTEAKISPWMAPFIFFSSLGTHLFGGSAGREGVGVIMGASASHLLSEKWFSLKNFRAILIYSGVAAGFSSIFGTPLAGIIFSFELHQFKDIKTPSLFISTMIASFAAFGITHLLGPDHQSFLVHFDFDKMSFLYCLIAVFAAAVGGNAFYWGFKIYSKVISRFFPKVEWKMFVGALLVAAIIYSTHGYEFSGIGTKILSQSFESEMSLYDFFMKCLLTVMTLAVGFKGGEVTPLFIMGSTLSNATASFFGLYNFGLSSSLGMVALFGAVTATPLASAVLAFELFGARVGILAIVVCLVARLLMFKRTIYRH